METWMVVFVGVIALAAITQTIILVMFFLQMQQSTREFTRMARDLHSRMTPILTRVQLTIDDAQPRISSLIADAAHVVHIARGQAQKVDRVLTDVAERLRVQLIHTDRILTGLLEAVEGFGAGMSRTVLRPMYNVSALVKGVRAGLDFFRRRKHSDGSSAAATAEAEEELFI